MAYYFFLGVLSIPMFVLIALHTDSAMTLAYELVAIMACLYFGYLAIQRDRFLKFLGFCLILIGLVFYYYAVIIPLVSGQVYTIKI